MKKFLSLVLALVMTMSLVTISAGATDFADDADIQYDEAVSVISAIGVVDGYTDGSFGPTNGLTRGAAAKIICNLILGPTTASELDADTNPYPDVDKNSTFAGYIAYCQKEGIISGYADGTFKPAIPLTGYAFMKMLLGALGYDASVEGYTGANWSINVAKQAIGIGLNAGLKEEFNGSDFVTREEAALYAFNTLKATMVDYDTTIVVGNVTIAGSNEYEVANNSKTEGIKDDNKMQFAEKYFTKLSVQDDTDAFERPASTWINGKETIGTYVDYTTMVAEYTTAVSGKDLYDVIGKTAFNDYDFAGYVDGAESTLCSEIAKNNKKDVTSTGNGALTQVFVNNDTEDVVVTVINTYLAQATMDYNAKKDSVSFDVYGLKNNVSVSGEDFSVADVKDDDFVLVTYSKSENAIQSIGEVEIIADTDIQKFTAGKDGSLTVDGTKYNYNVTATYDADVLKDYTIAGGSTTNLKDLTYNIYVDQYGYAIGVDLVETPDNFLFITGVDDASSNLSNKTWTANAIFMDGTTEVIEVKNNGVINSESFKNFAVINKWFSYTVSNSGVYTLSLVNETEAITDDKVETYDVAQAHSTEGDVKEINAKNISLKGVGADKRVYGNDATVYLLADLEKVNSSNVVINDVEEVVTGVKNAAFTTYGWDDAAKAVNATGTRSDENTSYGTYALYKSNGYVIAAVVVGESDTVSSDLAYVISDGVSSESYDKTDKTWTWTRDVVIGGVEVELTETNDTGLSTLETAKQHTWVTVKYDAKGNVKKIEAADYVTTVKEAVAKIVADKDDVIVLDTTAYGAYELKGSTLYDKTEDESGFLVAEDVKIVLNQTVKNKNTTTYDQGIKALEATLDNLNEVNSYYYFDAVIENGIATVVVIIDLGSDGGYTGPTGSTNSDYTAVVDKATLKVTVTYTGTYDEDQALVAAVEALEAAGYELASWDKTGSPYKAVVTNANGGSTTFEVVATAVV